MTGEEMERAIEFLLNHHARVSADIEGLKDSQKKTDAQVQSLSESVSRMEIQMGELRESIGELRTTVGSVIEEMREGFNNLIVANEVTRNLAETAARLAISASQRVATLEDKLQ
jgi:chromosome segregation ATPase